MIKASIAQIQRFAFRYPTIGWDKLKGQAMPSKQYVYLYSLLGTRFGGNGKTHFDLPTLSALDNINYSMCTNDSESGFFNLPHFIGQIILWPSEDIPHGWMECNGDILSISQEQELFAVIGNKFGGRDNETFCLPNIPPVSQYLKYIINSDGLYPSDIKGFVGGLNWFAGDIEILQSNWAKCEGQKVPIGDDEVLFSVIENYYGGNGTTDYNLPSIPDLIPGVITVIGTLGYIAPRKVG